MTNYSRGRAIEYKAIKELEATGLYSLIVRAAGSHGLFDIYALTPYWNSGKSLAIQIKNNCKPTSKEVDDMRRINLFGFEKQVWIWRPRKGFEKIEIK